ncbi:MAG: adenosylcobinamide-phosphate synthase CbiB [Cellulosilyticaceae bacterium]
MASLLALVAGFGLDLILGDPHHFPHPIRLIGHMIMKGEKIVRPLFSDTEKGRRRAGMVMSLTVIALAILIPFLILKVAYGINGIVGWCLETIMVYQILATKALKDESMKVYEALEKEDLPLARKMLSMIVGRDTACLDEEGITKAAIETVAENTSDGIIGPLLFLTLGGVPLGFGYKAVNTLDSMIGYKNEKYLDFGRFAAKLDDVLNYIPARLSAYIMIMAAQILGRDHKEAKRIYKRDRYNHKSPNSAHTEAVCAGALGIQLAGDAYYFGKLHKKPTIGDAKRTVDKEDIVRVNQLMYTTCILGLLGCALIRCFLL